ncbi:MAG TPA: ComEA family DNA-binding protein [Candidatus Sulfotelmatobacter sp.]|nr:ComEA family DNA-binding protein [Candidatus Sulfotelmatobacter sp.]
MDRHEIDWGAVDAALAGDQRDGPTPGATAPDQGPARGRPWATWLAIAALAALVLLGGSALLVAATPAPLVTLDEAVAAPTSASPQPSALLVDVEGAVRHPGVVRLAAGSRVADAIAAAGGYSGSVDAAAASSGLDLADPLQDGAKVLVPQRGASVGGAAASSPRAGKVDLNHATAAELDGLPGIGPVTAAKIIASREQQPFQRIDDLRTRKLIGAATFAKLQALVTV